MRVQRTAQALRLPIARHVHMGNLTQGVHSGVGPPRSSDWRSIRINLRDGMFQGSLDAGLVLLPLPAAKRLSVIFDFKRISLHGDAVPPQPPIAKT